jgi:hypothetical protein
MSDGDIGGGNSQSMATFPANTTPAQYSAAGAPRSTTDLLLSAISAAAEQREVQLDDGIEPVEQGTHVTHAKVLRPRGGGNDESALSSHASQSGSVSGSFQNSCSGHERSRSGVPPERSTMRSGIDHTAAACVTESTAAGEKSAEHAVHDAPFALVKSSKVPSLSLAEVHADVHADAHTVVSKPAISPGTGCGQESSGAGSDWIRESNASESVGNLPVASEIGALGSVPSGIPGEFVAGGVNDAGGRPAQDLLDGAESSRVAVGAEGAARGGGPLEVVEERSHDHTAYGDVNACMAQNDGNYFRGNANITPPTSGGERNAAHAAIVAARRGSMDWVSPRDVPEAEAEHDSSRIDTTPKIERHNKTAWMLERNASDKWRKSKRHVYNIPQPSSLPVPRKDRTEVLRPASERSFLVKQPSNADAAATKAPAFSTLTKQELTVKESSREQLQQNRVTDEWLNSSFMDNERVAEGHAHVDSQPEAQGPHALPPVATQTATKTAFAPVPEPAAAPDTVNTIRSYPVPKPSSVNSNVEVQSHNEGVIPHASHASVEPINDSPLAHAPAQQPAAAGAPVATHAPSVDPAIEFPLHW